MYPSDGVWRVRVHTARQSGGGKDQRRLDLEAAHKHFLVLVLVASVFARAHALAYAGVMHDELCRLQVVKVVWLPSRVSAWAMALHGHAWA